MTQACLNHQAIANSHGRYICQLWSDERPRYWFAHSSGYTSETYNTAWAALYAAATCGYRHYMRLGVFTSEPGRVRPIPDKYLPRPVAVEEQAYPTHFIY